MAFTAKVYVATKNRSDETTIVTFSPDYGAGRNAEWSKWTPALTLSMSIKNELADTIKSGQAYTLTFEENNE